MQLHAHKPIKRKKMFIRFSREHHYGLLFVWKIRCGIRNHIPAERIADFTLFFFENDLRNHFKAEETTLFPKLNTEHPFYKKAGQEHQAIYRLITDMEANKHSADLLNEFADMLEKHIRFEEREMFNYLQSKLSEEELTTFAENLDEKPEDVSQKWTDKFWQTTLLANEK